MSSGRKCTSFKAGGAWPCHMPELVAGASGVMPAARAVTLLVALRIRPAEPTDPARGSRGGEEGEAEGVAAAVGLLSPAGGCRGRRGSCWEG